MTGSVARGAVFRGVFAAAGVGCHLAEEGYAAFVGAVFAAVAGLVLSHASGLSAAGAATHALPRCPADACLGAARAHILVDEVSVALLDADALSVKPIVACAVAADHEGARIGSFAEAVEIVADWCALFFLFLLILWIYRARTIGWCGRGVDWCTLVTSTLDGRLGHARRGRIASGSFDLAFLGRRCFLCGGRSALLLGQRALLGYSRLRSNIFCRGHWHRRLPQW